MMAFCFLLIVLCSPLTFSTPNTLSHTTQWAPSPTTTLLVEDTLAIQGLGETTYDVDLNVYGHAQEDCQNQATKKFEVAFSQPEFISTTTYDCYAVKLTKI